MRNSGLVDAFLEHSKLKPTKSNVYLNSSEGYTNFKRLLFSKEFTVSLPKKQLYGIIPEISTIWYSSRNRLFFYNYFTNTTDFVTDFGFYGANNKIFVHLFMPDPQVFDVAKVEFCLFIASIDDGKVYAVERETHLLIETKFNCKFSIKEIPTAVTSIGSNIFIGTENGDVLIVKCNEGSLFTQRYLSVINTTSGFLYNNISTYFNKIVPFSLFSGKAVSKKIRSMSVDGNYLVVLSDTIQVYAFEGNSLKRISTIYYTGEEYCTIQILEVEKAYPTGGNENSNNSTTGDKIFICATTRKGKRDFYDFSHILFSKNLSFINNGSISHCSLTTNINYLHTKNQLVTSYKKNGVNYLSLISFNEFSKANSSKMKLVENLDFITEDSDVLLMHINNNVLFMLNDFKLKIYTICNDQELIIHTNGESIYSLFDSYGDMYFMTNYYHLLSSVDSSLNMSNLINADSLCTSIQVKKFGLFLCIAELLNPIWRVDIKSGISNNKDYTNQLTLERVVRKFKILKERLPASLDEPKLLIDDFLQTVYYVKLLDKYNVSYKETFESLITKDSSFFNKNTLKTLIKVVGNNGGSIDHLNKILKYNCGKFFPVEQINFTRGMELISNSNNSKDFYESLKYFELIPFSPGVLEIFTAKRFFYGGVTLLSSLLTKKALNKQSVISQRNVTGILEDEDFKYNYGELVSLFRKCVKCSGAVDRGLKETEEAFLYPFFEALVELPTYEGCSCCLPSSFNTVIELHKIRNPLFLEFLKERSFTEGGKYNLEWKIYAYRGEHRKAIEALVSLSYRNHLTFEQKCESLRIARSLDTTNADIRLRLSLIEIQKKMMERKPSKGNLSTILSADSLLNDYCYDLPDLAIRILDLVNFREEDRVSGGVLRGFYKELFESTNIGEFYLFLSNIKNKNLTLIIDLLITKIDKANLCQSLLNANFEYSDIINNVKLLLMDNNPPILKKKLLEEVKVFGRFNEYESYKTMCNNLFGL